MCDLPGPGVEPVSPALAGGFLTTEPPAKPLVGGFLLSSLPALFAALQKSQLVSNAVRIDQGERGGCCFLCMEPWVKAQHRRAGVL